MVANYQPMNGQEVKEFEACTKPDIEVEIKMQQEPYLTLHAIALANNNK